MLKKRKVLKIYKTVSGGLIDGHRTDKTGKVRSGMLNEFAQYWYETMEKQCWFSTIAIVVIVFHTYPTL